jgi:hypothetical protein
MLVGRKEIVFTDLKRACRSSDALQKFALSLVPMPLQHLSDIIGNQKYYVALQVRAIQSLTWKTKKQLCEDLLHGVRVKGIPTVLYDYEDILMAIDREAFARYLEEETHAER